MPAQTLSNFQDKRDIISPGVVWGLHGDTEIVTAFVDPTSVGSLKPGDICYAARTPVNYEGYSVFRISNDGLTGGASASGDSVVVNTFDVGIVLDARQQYEGAFNFNPAMGTEQSYDSNTGAIPVLLRGRVGVNIEGVIGNNAFTEIPYIRYIVGANPDTQQYGNFSSVAIANETFRPDNITYRTKSNNGVIVVDIKRRTLTLS